MVDIDRAWFKAVADAFQAVDLTGTPVDSAMGVLRSRQVRPPATAFENVFVRGLWVDSRLPRLTRPDGESTDASDRDLLGWPTGTRRAVLAIRQMAIAPGLRRADVAQALSLSESRIAHLLTATGLGFCDHVHLARTSEAARLLLETGLSIKEITAAVGYAAGGLDRPFAARFGAAPREWRKQRHLQSVRCLSAGGTDG